MTGRLHITALTHRGARREVNEDTIRIGGWTSSADMMAPVQRLEPLRMPLFCGVADGLGGHSGGALASSYVMARLGREAASLDAPATITPLLRRLAAEVVQIGAERAAPRPPGTTLAALVCAPGGGRALAVNVGDSRIYRLSHRGVDQISVDDTAPASGGREADPPEKDGRTGQQGHALSQAIGGGHPPQNLTPHVAEIALTPGERWLLCTDGLTDLVGNSEINAAALRLHDDDDTLVADLFALAMDRGGRDNISVCVVRPIA